MNNEIVRKNELDLLGEAKRVIASIDVNEVTKRDYEYRIKLFLEFIRGRKLGYDTLVEYKRYLSNRTDIGVSTKNKYYIGAKVFLKELYRRGELPVDITANVRGFRQNKKHKKVGLTDGEVAKISEVLKAMGDTEEAIRVRAIISLLVYQGLRQIEVIRLDVGDIDIQRGVAYIRGKGRDDKEVVYLHPYAVECLKEYLRAFNLKDGALFVSLSNRNKKKRLTTRSIQNIVKDIFERAGIEGKTTHGFRHYFVTKLLQAYKGDIIAVSQFTRHKSLEMLQVYNDMIVRESDLPRFYQVFDCVRIA
jgi:integrase